MNVGKGRNHLIELAGPLGCMTPYGNKELKPIAGTLG